jgi:hypothetical protein
MHMLRRNPAAGKGILTSMERGAMRVQFRLEDCAAAVLDLMLKYSDTPADLADACLIHMADELNTWRHPHPRQRFPQLSLAQKQAL